MSADAGRGRGLRDADGDAVFGSPLAEREGYFGERTQR